MNNEPFTMIKETMTLWVGPTHEPTEFEALLADWQAGGPIGWAELMAAWVEMPTAPLSRSLVLRLILGLIEK